MLFLVVVLSQLPAVAVGQANKKAPRPLFRNGDATLLKSHHVSEASLEKQTIIDKIRDENSYRRTHQIRAQKAFISQKGFFRLSAFEPKSVLLADTAGRIVKYESYEKITTIYETELYTEAFEFFYDPYDNVAQYNKYFSSGNTVTITFEHDSSRFMTKIVYDAMEVYPEDQKYNFVLPRMFSFFVYPYNGFVKYFSPELFRFQEIGASGKLLNNSKFVVSEENKVVNMVLFSEWMHDASITTYTYNERGDETGRVILDKRGKPLVRLAFSYNDVGLLETVSWLNKKNKPFRMERYEYEYY